MSSCIHASSASADSSASASASASTSASASSSPSASAPASTARLPAARGILAALLLGCAIALPSTGLRAADAGEGADGAAAGECPVGREVSTLLARWKAAASEAAALTPAQKDAARAKLAGAAKSCPVGARLGFTVAAARDALAAVIACDDASAKHCPLESEAAKTGPNAAAYAPARELKEARAGILRQLHGLASATAGFTAASGCCEAAACAGTDSTTSAVAQKESASSPAKGAACCADEAASCPIRIASRLGAARAALAAAREEIAALPVERRREMLASFTALSESCSAVALVPPSVSALASGFDALADVGGKLEAWAASHPELAGSIPEETVRAFRLKAALLDEARGAVAQLKDAMSDMSAGLEGAQTARKG